MHFTDEELISYLLGDAPLAMARQIEDQVSTSPALVMRLEQFRTLLESLDDLDAEADPRFEPPAGLVESTMARIFDGRNSEDPESFNNPEDVSTPEGFGGEREQPTRLEHSGKSRDAEKRLRVTAPRLSIGFDPPRNRRSLWDSTALTISLTILCCLALPALVRARFEARKAQCAENMRDTGRGLLDFAMNNPDRRLPGIDSSGPLAFAGAYAVRLYNAGLLPSIEQLSCPSLGGRFPIADLEALGLDQHFIKQGSLRIPTEAELLSLSEQQLPIVQSMIGGSYAYHLGVVENNRPVPPRHEGRTHLAILADAPVFVEGTESFVAHDGYGINILYDDGRVHFFSISRLQASRMKPMEVDFLADDPFFNELHEHRAGLHEDDASLAPSHYSPLGAN